MRSWLPTVSIAIAAFIFVTSEFIPVGLLSEIAGSFGRTESQTGLMMTVYAWIVAALSIPLTAYVTKFDRRPLMLWLVALFSVAHILSVVAWSFPILIVSRVFVAIAHAVYWAIAIPLGIRLAPAGKRNHAMSIVSTGATLGSLLGIPVGTYLGQIFGWRLSFGLIGACAALIGGVLFKILPSSEGRGDADFRSVMNLLQRRNLVLIYLITIVSMTGHYAVFTFISPFLQEIGQLPSKSIASVLLMYGVSGLLGGFIAPRLVTHRLRLSTYVGLAIVGVSLLVFRYLVTSYGETLLLVFVWGIAFTFFNLVLQNLVLTTAPDMEDVAMAGYSGLYNVGIGGGALIGSLASVAHLSVLGFIGAGCIFVSWFICLYLDRSSNAFGV